MGMYDEVRMVCPVCKNPTIVQSKCGPCNLKKYTLDDAPLFVIADIHQDSQHDDLLCSHCGVKLKLIVQIKTKLVSADGLDDADWRDMG